MTFKKTGIPKSSMDIKPDQLDAHPYYLDASAVVRLVIKEPGFEIVQACFRRGSNFRMTAVSLAEAFGVLKTKFRKEQITADQYYESAIILAAYISESIEVETETLNNPNMVYECQGFSEKYGIDLADALQLWVIKNGPMKHFIGNSEPILVTADQDLVKAAEQEKICVLNCSANKVAKS